jgi:hypothetical protein
VIIGEIKDKRTIKQKKKKKKVQDMPLLFRKYKRKMVLSIITFRSVFYTKARYNIVLLDMELKGVFDDCYSMK